MTVLFKLYSAGAHKKIYSQIKGFLYFVCYPSLGKKDILSTLSVPCYCHVNEGLPGQPHQKAVQVHAQVAEDGPGEQGIDDKVMKFSRLTCSCSLVIVHYSLANFFFYFFGLNTFGHSSYVFHLFCHFFLQISMDVGFI